MLALTIKQPWAWAILNTVKDIENISWNTYVRGPILIHASKIDCSEGFDVLKKMGFSVPRKKLERGGVVGSVCVVNCVEKSTSKWYIGDYGLELSNPQMLPFTPLLGKEKFFNVDISKINLKKCNMVKCENRSSIALNGCSVIAQQIPINTCKVRDYELSNGDIRQGDQCGECGSWWRIKNKCRVCGNVLPEKKEEVMKKVGLRKGKIWSTQKHRYLTTKEIAKGIK